MPAAEFALAGDRWHAQNISRTVVHALMHCSTCVGVKRGRGSPRSHRARAPTCASAACSACGGGSQCESAPAERTRLEKVPQTQGPARVPIGSWRAPPRRV
eukprot:2714561-Prymnesium_polylepis.1